MLKDRETKREREREARVEMSDAYLIVDSYIGHSRPGTSEHVMRIVSGEFSAVIQTTAAVPLSNDVTSQTHWLVLRIQRGHSVQMLDRRIVFRSGQVVSAQQSKQTTYHPRNDIYRLFKRYANSKSSRYMDSRLTSRRYFWNSNSFFSFATNRAHQV